jgi:hydroxyacylglutathione hydrolase
LGGPLQRVDLLGEGHPDKLVMAAGWHACKRVFAFALMIHDGIPLDDVSAYLSGQPWLIDFATTVFNTTAEVFAAELLSEMRRSGAVEERDGRLVCLTPHHRPVAGWLWSPGYPREWRWLARYEPKSKPKGGVSPV